MFQFGLQPDIVTVLQLNLDLVLLNGLEVSTDCQVELGDDLVGALHLRQILGDVRVETLPEYAVGVEFLQIQLTRGFFVVGQVELQLVHGYIINVI